MTDRARVNTSGHIVSVDDETETFTGTVSEAAGFVVGSVCFGDGAGSYSLYDSSSETDCDSIQGISDNTYADAATATMHGDGSVVTGLAGLTPDAEYYADPTTGQPGLYSAIGSGEWTMLLGRARSATELKLSFGAVFQKE